jgi:transcription initiation factor IIF auxiliary subunit
VNQPSIDEIFDSRKINKTNFDMNKLDKIYSEKSQENYINNNNNKSFDSNQIKSLMNQHFNYNHVYNNIEQGKKEIDPFSFVDDMLKPKKN